MSTTWRMSAELLGMVFLAASYGLAQELPPPATKAEASTSGQSEVPTDKIRLPKGMAVRRFLIEPISIRTAKAGDPVKLQVLGPVKVDNLVVIANKAPASATITEVYKSGQEVAMDWHAGGLKLQMDSVMLTDQQKQPLKAQDAPKEEHTSELQSPCNLVCRLPHEKKKRAAASCMGNTHGDHVFRRLQASNIPH